MPHSGKYGPVTLARPVGVAGDEPVFLLVAHDRLALAAIRYYREMCRVAGAGSSHLDGIDAAAADFELWQETHSTKLPDSAPMEDRWSLDELLPMVKDEDVPSGTPLYSPSRGVILAYIDGKWHRKGGE